MTDRLIVRFTEYLQYDPMADCEMATLMATTPVGTYSARVIAEGSAGALRAHRAQFKDYVIDAMQRREPPHEVMLDG